METESGTFNLDWRQELPTLAGRRATLREPTSQDIAALVALLSLADATRFGVDDQTSEFSVQQLIERAHRDRAAGLSFTYAVLTGSRRTLVGLIQARQLDPSFEVAEWECTLAPAARGSGVFVEAARLAGGFAFSVVGARRLEARTLLHNGRASTALRKLGAVQEGVLRRSVQLRGQYVDQALWSILKDDWGEQRVSIVPRVH
jgi:RimJ/RimL family protein N-acetyltransferase